MNDVKEGQHYTRLGSRFEFSVWFWVAFKSTLILLLSSLSFLVCIFIFNVIPYIIIQLILSGFGDVQGILYTEHNIDNVKYHGNPFSGWQDWCGMDMNDKILPCHLLIYLHLLDSPSTPVITKYGTVSMPGHYVLIHSVVENVFQDVPTTHQYKTKYPDFWLIKMYLWMGQRN